MTKRWRLTRQAEQSLTDIAVWTVETFGSRQSEIYENELIERCQAIADGRAVTQSCAVLIEDASGDDIRFARAGKHFVVFLESAEEISIIDFLHSRTDLPRRIAGLNGSR